MLITFHSKVAPEVLMLEEHALPLLIAAGKMSAGQRHIPERGIFTAEQLQAAIAGIEQAIANARPPASQDEDQDDQGNPLPPMARRVSLQQRAFPLLDLLKNSQGKGVAVTWETSKGS